MSDAIARFREVALTIRRHSDQSFSYLRWEVVAWAEKSFCTRCRWLLRDFEAGRLAPLAYARELRRERQRAELRVLLTPSGQKQFSVAEWLPPSMQADPPNIKRLADAAAKGALAWGRLFSVADSRVRALSRATAALGKPYNLAPEEYGKALSRWQAAFDALAPFIEQPPVPAATSEKKTEGTKQKKRRDRKRGGGRPVQYPMKFIREVFAARERDQKHAAKAKQRLPAWAPWLWDYCADSIKAAEMFPPKFKGEPWQARAERFRKAAKKRLKAPDGN